MKYILKIITILLIVSILSIFHISCASFFDMNEPEVLKITPENHTQGIELRPKIYIEFSEEMDKPKTESAFSIDSDSGSPKGYFRWEGTRLFFDLVENLQNGGIYTIKISDTAEDINGNNIHEDRESRFYVGDDFIKPELISFSIQRTNDDMSITIIPITDGMNGVLKNDTILIEFSEAISLPSTESGFSISPSIIGTKTLSDDCRTLQFTPYSGFDNKTGYIISLKDDLTDSVGNTLLEERQISFIVGSDFTKPTLESADDTTVGIFSRFEGTQSSLEFENVNTGIVEKNSEIQLVFSEAMSRKETCDAISVTPTVDYTLDWGIDNRTISIQLTSGNIFKLNEVYTVTVSDSALDLEENRLDREYTSSFRVNGTHSKAIYIEDIRQMSCDASGPVNFLNTKSLMNPYEVIDISSTNSYYRPIATYPDENVYIIRILFNNETGDLSTRGINIYSALESITFKFDTYTGDDTNHTDLYPVIWKMSVPGSVQNAVDVYIYNIEAKNYYLLDIKGGETGISDKSNNNTGGNYMLDDYTNVISV